MKTERETASAFVRCLGCSGGLIVQALNWKHPDVSIMPVTCSHCGCKLIAIPEFKWPKAGAPPSFHISLFFQNESEMRRLLVMAANGCTLNDHDMLGAIRHVQAVAAPIRPAMAEAEGLALEPATAVRLLRKATQAHARNRG